MILLKPSEIVLTDGEGVDRTFVLSKFPAILGREIVTQYPTTAMPKVGDYKTNEALMMKIMARVGVPRDSGEPLLLSTPDLVNNHVPDFETLLKLEWAMMQYNCSFFRNGKVSTFFGFIAQQARALISETLTASSAQSSAKD